MFGVEGLAEDKAGISVYSQRTMSCVEVAGSPYSGCRFLISKGEHGYRNKLGDISRHYFPLIKLLLFL